MAYNDDAQKKTRFWSLFKNYLSEKSGGNGYDGDVSNGLSRTPGERAKSFPNNFPSENDYPFTPNHITEYSPPSWNVPERDTSHFPHDSEIDWGNYMKPSGDYGGPIEFSYGNPGRELINSLPPSVVGSSTVDPYDAWLHQDAVYVTRIPAVTPIQTSPDTYTPLPTTPLLYSLEISPVFHTDSPSQGDFLDYNVQQNVTSPINSTLCDMDILESSKWIYLYGIAFLVAIAILFNGVAFGVFSTKALRKFAFSSYLAGLAVADTLALLSQLPRQWMVLFYATFGWEAATTYYDSNDAACKAFTFLSYVFRMLSAWLSVALAAERATVAVEPFKKSHFRKRNSAFKIVIYLFVISMLVNCHVIFTWSVLELGSGEAVCSPDLPSDSLSYTVTVLTVIIITALPFIVASVLTVVIVRGLRSRSWKLKPQRMTANAICRLELERKAAIMVAIVTGSFSLLSFPYTVTWVVLLAQPWSKSVTICQKLAAAAARDVTEVIFMLNYTVKFALCIFGGSDLLNMK